MGVTRLRVWIAALAAGALGLGAVSALAQDLGGDAARGKDVFDDRCSDCHVLEGVGQGPSLIGVVGRKAGSVPGYGYTDAIKAFGRAWTPAELDQFLQGPKKLVPGTAMEVIVPDASQRHDLIAYLASLKPPKS
jgi:cytochrome c2